MKRGPKPRNDGTVLRNMVKVPLNDIQYEWLMKAMESGETSLADVLRKLLVEKMETEKV